MSGYVHMFRLGSEVEKSGRAVPQFQLTYTAGGNSFVRVFEPAGLEEFIRSNLGITAAAADKAMADLRAGQPVTINDVEIPEHQTAAMGLEQLPSDY